MLLVGRKLSPERRPGSDFEDVACTSWARHAWTKHLPAPLLTSVRRSWAPGVQLAHLSYYCDARGRRHQAATVLPCEHLAVALASRSPLYHLISSPRFTLWLVLHGSVDSRPAGCRVSIHYHLRTSPSQLKAGRFQSQRNRCVM